MDARPAIDVSHLPPIAFDKRSTAWWGNTLFMVIETVTTFLLLVSYYYTWQNVEDWPPSLADNGIATADPLPSLGAATFNLLLLLGSCLPMYEADRAARRFDQATVQRRLLILVGLGCLSIWLRFREFTALKFRWDDNAYASLVWAILFIHLSYLIVAVVEVAVISAWIARYGLDENQADDVTLTAVYWLWMVGLWVPLYLTVFWAPRIL